MATFPVTTPQENAAPAHATRRWLHVVSHTDPRYGGLSSAVPALAASLEEQDGLRVALAAFCAPREEHRPVQATAAGITFWPTSRVQWMRNRQLRREFDQAVRGVEGLHIHGLWEQSTAVACKVARRLDKPYVLSAHGMLEPWALAAKKLKKRVYAALLERANVAGAACLHALTLAEARQYRDFGAKNPIAVIPNAVALPVGATAELFLERFPQLRGKRIVLFLSRLHAKKGLDLLVEAWARTAGEHPEAQLVIAGPDTDGMQAKLEAAASQAGIAERITFTGILTGDLKWSALAAAAVYVLPSYSEGLSMALLEAMGMGLPVIATRACNMPEIATAHAGWEIDADAEALTSALGDFLKGSPEENGKKGCNGARLVAARYTTERVAQQMAAVYAYVSGGPRPDCVDTWKGGSR